MRISSTTLKKYLRPVIAFILLLLVLKMGLIDLDQLSLSFKNPTILAAGLVFFTLHTLTLALRWNLLVNLEINYPFKTAAKQTLIGNFFNFFIPSGVGGDIVKALAISESHKVPKKMSFSLVTIDRVLGLFSLILFSTSFLLVEYFFGMSEALTKLLHISLLLLAVACLGLLFLYHSQKIIPRFKDKFKFFIFQKLFSFAEQVQVNIAKAMQSPFMLKFIGTSFLMQCMSIGFLYVVTLTLTQEPVSIFIFLPLACFAFMASAIPLTPAGIGVGQAAFYFIFSFINIPTATAITTGVSLMQFFMLLTSLPGGYFFATSRKGPQERKVTL
ncbi:MAG: lysylphosphatidylglycerol synthase transmembrane domain-containing protein [Bdellovibrionota bacterium]